MKLQEKQELFCQNVSALIIYIFSQGYKATFGDAYRSPAQAALNAEIGTGIKDSLHCKRLAIDLNLFDKSGKYVTAKDEYEKFGVFWEGLNKFNRWGGRFEHLVDSNHFEMRDL